MSTVAEPLTANILHRHLRWLTDLLRETLQLAHQMEKSPDEVQSFLEQSVRLSLRVPALMRDLWEWCLQRDRVGRLPDRPLIGTTLRDQLSNWLEFLDRISQSARSSEAAGYPIQGADELLGAADELATIGQEINESWPVEEMPPPAASTGLSYQELRSLADLPPATDWPEEDFEQL